MSLLRRLSAFVERVRHSDDGQGLAEYALILALIAIVAIIALIFMGSQISDKLSVIGSTLESASGLDPLKRLDRGPSGTGRAVVVFRRRMRSAQPCESPCDTHGFLPNLPKGPSPLV